MFADCLSFFARRRGMVSREGEAQERPVWMLREPWGARLRGRKQALPQEPGLTVPETRAPSPQGERSLARTCPEGRAARGRVSPAVAAQGRQPAGAEEGRPEKAGRASPRDPPIAGRSPAPHAPGSHRTEVALDTFHSLLLSFLPFYNRSYASDCTSFPLKEQIVTQTLSHTPPVTGSQAASPLALGCGPGKQVGLP